MGIKERNKQWTNFKRNEIIDGMEKALLSKNYDHLTIDDVAQKAEYSKKTIYSYFKSKDEIYWELLIRKFELLFDTLQSAIEGSPKKGIEKIGILGTTYYRFAKEFPEYMQAIINYEAQNADEDHEHNKLIERFNTETEKSFLLLEKMIQEGIDDQSISAGTDIVGTAILFWSNMNGFFMLASKKGEYIKNTYGKTLDELLEQNIEMLLRSLRP
ncbi:TetR/AcrR family transcriptional regulator [Ethanoligenens harbinense]|uniref:Transcriptional regulator, TetR family n=1 Tax=Ethanoligenens harbinense (strain DSM 18485 / JCM 12961 / CGMCC 1.5033 / YUAN-3) TaxID=663278 RepID=E6U4G3_ETHHY|nr:TetR/AcrR family transcriptional regulator [Ethanoligenens harbinense]ADU27770.1 transcriptional regulator, TetR family [Ethanoligenens harbinense YUAN-3]AVQ96793.1 TetR/AcrR family transcriptional regulator [Ethanoligenens harbinense YUAN-3]AYF39455.1 TetR/AcrR family transcriptional regulator [Ethanoligenens harbinense]AYF42279.1 TetR/AcrR family transcriptional regulator [Ethanoligenens harbinense]QCN93034.1 TetR/AcrR family transcriptional regulator [Ethanoligenens harbinense]